MNYELEILEDIVNSWKQRVGNVGVQDLEEIKDRLQIEMKRLEKLMISQLLSLRNETMVNSYFTIHMHKLSSLADRLYDGIAEGIDTGVVIPVLNLIDALRKIYPSLVTRDLILPNAFRAIHGTALLQQWDELTTSWQSLGIDKEILEVAFLPLEEFGDLSKKLSWFHYSWIQQYLSSLENLDFSNYKPYPAPGYLISDHLALFNFNHAAFISFCHRLLQQRINRHKQKEDQLYLLRVAKKVIKQQRIISDVPFFYDKKSVKEELLHWIKEETDFRSLFDTAILESEGKVVPVNVYKYVYNMKVDQLAFWKKLQYDNGVYAEDNLDVFSAKIAYNASTKTTEDLSAKSVKSKLYGKEDQVIKPIYELIEKMLDDMSPSYKLLLNMRDEIKNFIR